MFWESRIYNEQQNSEVLTASTFEMKWSVHILITRSSDGFNSRSPVYFSPWSCHLAWKPLGRREETIMYRLQLPLPVTALFLYVKSSLWIPSVSKMLLNVKHLYCKVKDWKYSTLIITNNYWKLSESGIIVAWETWKFIKVILVGLYALWGIPL